MIYGRVKFWTDIYPNILMDAEYERDMARFRDFIVPGGADDEEAQQTQPARIAEKPRKKKTKNVAGGHSEVTATLTGGANAV